MVVYRIIYLIYITWLKYLSPLYDWDDIFRSKKKKSRNWCDMWRRWFCLSSLSWEASSSLSVSSTRDICTMSFSVPLLSPLQTVIFSCFYYLFLTRPAIMYHCQIHNFNNKLVIIPLSSIKEYTTEYSNSTIQLYLKRIIYLKRNFIN